MMANWFYNAIQHRLRNSDNWLLAIVGPTGSGKSYAALRLAYDLDIDPKTGEHRFPLDASHVIFNPRDFISLVRGKKFGNLPTGSFVIMDEAALSLNSQTWWSVEAQIMGGLTQSFRYKCLGTIFTFPGSFDFLNKQQRALVHTLLQMRFVNKSEKISVGDFKNLQTNVFTGKIYQHNPVAALETGEEIQMGNFEFHLPPSELVKNYEARKAEFLDGYYAELEAKLDKATNSKVDIKTYYDKILENPTLYMDGKRFRCALIRVKLNVSIRNAAHLVSALNYDLRNGRVDLKKNNTLVPL